MIDLHVHTALCGHAQGMPADYVRAAAERGITVLGFTDHMPLAPGLAASIPDAAGYAMAASDLDRYIAEVQGAAREGAALGVEVLLGVEADLLANDLEHARQLVSAHRFDIVLGSVHFIDEWAFDDPRLVARYEEWDISELWERYFEDVAVAAASGIADVIAHVDLVKKFCGAPERPLRELFHAAAHALGTAGVAVEVNTAGLRKPCAEIYPSEELLRALHAARVPVTLGSDAHAPGDVGRDLEHAVSLLKSVGYESCLVFRQRVPQEVSLDGL